jgi:hypothetical protein
MRVPPIRGGADQSFCDDDTVMMEADPTQTKRNERVPYFFFPFMYEYQEAFQLVFFFYIFFICIFIAYYRREALLPSRIHLRSMASRIFSISSRAAS